MYRTVIDRYQVAVYFTYKVNTRWFKYDRDYLCVNKLQFVLVIFEPPCMSVRGLLLSFLLG
jgi:hypothetical protein